MTAADEVLAARRDAAVLRHAADLIERLIAERDALRDHLARMTHEYEPSGHVLAGMCDRQHCHRRQQNSVHMTPRVVLAELRYGRDPEAPPVPMAAVDWLGRPPS